MSEKVNRRAVVWFLVITFGFSWPLFVLPLAFGRPEEGTSYQLTALPAWVAAMWGPGLAALIVTRFVLKEKLGSLNLRRLGPKRFYLWAWLLPIALSILTGLLTFAFGLGKPDWNFTLIREAMANAPGGDAIPAGMVVAIQMVFAFTLAPLFNVLFALGEELGWRGFLLPRLLPLGQWPAIVASGVIWGIWHAPAIAQGLNYPGLPVLGVFMMIVFTVLLGAIFSWLYLKTQSPWAPALAHGSVNATAGLPILFMPDVNLVVAGSLASVVGWIALAACVAWLALTRRLPVVAEAPA